MALIDKLKKNSTLENAAILSKSKYFNEKDMVQTSVPMLNVALAGRLDGGLTPGLTVFAAPSKMFKTGFSLLLLKSYLTKYPDAAALFYDSEFGTPGSYFDSFEIDRERIFHSPILDVEQLKFDIMKQLMNIDRGDKVIIVIDSIGTLASKKEVEDAINEKSVADMTRAKQIKSLFRLVTPHLNIKDIPMVVVNHTYKSMDLFSHDVVAGGTGAYYSADNIFTIRRKQEKETENKIKKVVGYDFTLVVEKSRYVKEKSEIPITVSFEGGIDKWSGLFDLAIGGGFIKKDADIEGKEKQFWPTILKTPEFQKFIKDKYLLSSSEIIKESEIEIYDAEIEKTIGKK